MLSARLSGVPPKTQLRTQVKPGDRVIAYVGAPERLFVGDAVVERGYHRWSEEGGRFPDWLGYDHGITLVDVRVWPRAVPLMSAWQHTIGARTNPKALWFGGIIKLLPSDGRAILAAGIGGSNQAPEDQGTARAASANPAMSAPPAPPEPPAASVRQPGNGQRLGSTPGAFVGTAAEPPAAPAAGNRSALPDAIAHADWGTAKTKRIVATAELGSGGVYVAHKARIVAQAGALAQRMRVPGSPKTTLLGFDFPIGVPRAYAARSAIENFATWLRVLDVGAPLFTVADHIGEVSIERPFFPRNITEKSPGLKGQFRAALGLTAQESLRRCDSGHTERGAASEMFWTLGPKAVGKATLAGWQEALKPALSDKRRQVAIWPFDGPLSELLDRFDVVIVETYPAEFYRRLGLRIGTIGHSKTSPEARRAAAPPLLAWCSDNGVVLDDELVGQILDGFGPGSDGEDPFDAVVGLLGMIATVRRGSEPDLPDDPAVRQIEGWMFGQPAPSPLPRMPTRHPAAEPGLTETLLLRGPPTAAKPPAGDELQGDFAGTAEPGQPDGIIVGPDGVARCWWAELSPEARFYHDEEWGVPNDNDRLLFDQLSFQVIQGGVSWAMVLGKRPGMRRAFAGFDFERVARFDETDVARLLEDRGIVRSQQKIEAVIHNARCAVRLANEEGSLARYVWRFEPASLTGAWDRARMETERSIPESRALASDMKRRGWRFVGPYSMYLFMQTAGLVNSHLDGCDRRERTAGLRADFKRP